MAQTGLDLIVFFTSPPGCWYYRYALPFLELRFQFEWLCYPCLVCIGGDFNSIQ